MWQTRNIAEHAYCPRLFYFMQVEGVFLPSTDTVQGVAVHRRVDKPSQAPASPEEGDSAAARPVAVRSLALSSEALQLTAKLDLAEISGVVAVPVEYRKGRPKRSVMSPPPDELDEVDDPPLAQTEPWPTDRVQVGLQVLLLEEAGYTVPRAVLYYAEVKLRLDVPVDDTLRADARACLAAAQRTAEAGQRPPPLVNDSRCARCSLQPFCLPDELNYLKAEGDEEAEPARPPRKLWPPRAEGEHVIVQKYGARVGVRGESLRVTDNEGRVLKELPLAGVESVYLLGHVQITSQAVAMLAEKGVPVAWLSAAGRLQAVTDPLDSVSATVRRAQVLRLEDPVMRLELARTLITAKIQNQRTLLMRNAKPPTTAERADTAGATDLPPHPIPLPLGGGEGARRAGEGNASALSTSAADSGIDGRASLERAVVEMSHHAAAAAKASDLEVVRGHEGQAAALYFAHLPGTFKDQEIAAEFAKHGRDRRPPPDPVNACLSFAYAMLTHECIAALRLARLEPSLGGFHRSKPGRPALALDLMEPFRPLIADSLALAAFNRGELGAGHFFRSAAGCVFTDTGRRAFFSCYDRRMNAEVTHPAFGYRLTYRRMLGLHARLIAAWLLGEVPVLTFLTTR
ncbi:MAG: CRISPR-associated endonuclease Cas1 [Verrucomicrobia bacterium]|nr:CRISPR-associated endonuclease Cas1 [Verrucomicrobiota bacterium]